MEYDRARARIFARPGAADSHENSEPASSAAQGDAQSCILSYA